MKRVSRLWGKPFHRGYILWMPPLTQALLFSEYVEYGKAIVSTKDLRQVLKSVGTQDVLLRVNGGLQVQAVERYTVPNPDYPGTRMVAHRLSRNNVTHYIKGRRELNGVGVILKIKIRPYGRKNGGEKCA